MPKGLGDFGATDKGVERKDERTRNNIQNNFLSEGDDF